MHLDLDVLDESVGKVNDFESARGLHEDDLVPCMNLLPKKSLTMCSFNTNLGDGDKVATIGIRATVTFVESLVATSVLRKAT